MMVNNLPIYTGKRQFLGRKDLVVSFYTKRCRYRRCSFCAIPSNSSDVPVSEEDINSQIDHVWNMFSSEISSFEQFSMGNEGSILDEITFPSGSLEYLIGKINSLDNSPVLSLETRAEFVSEDKLCRIKDMFSGDVDVTVGFETQDDYVRNSVLGKGLSKELFESKVELLSDFGVRLTGYVMLKPSPYMTEPEGLKEAVDTVTYLSDITKARGVDLIVYLIPTYIAKGTPLARQMADMDYKPPLMSSIRRVTQHAHQLGVPVYLGLWSEGLAEPDGTSSQENVFERRARGNLIQFNRTGQTSCVYSTLM